MSHLTANCSSWNSSDHLNAGPRRGLILTVLQLTPKPQRQYLAKQDLKATASGFRGFQCESEMTPEIFFKYLVPVMINKVTNICNDALVWLTLLHADSGACMPLGQTLSQGLVHEGTGSSWKIGWQTQVFRFTTKAVRQEWKQTPIGEKYNSLCKHLKTNKQKKTQTVKKRSKH